MINVGNRFVRCDPLANCVASDSTAPPFDKLRAPQPSLSAIEAVESAAQHLGLSVNHSLTVQRRGTGSAQEVLLSDGGISQDPIPVKLVYQPVEGRDELRLAWDITIHLENGQNWWNLRVDALTGEVLEQQDWIVNDSWEVDEEAQRAQEEASGHLDAKPRPRVPEESPNLEHSGTPRLGVPASGQYRVFPFPYISPEDPGVSHTLVTDPADPIASPFGWHDTDGVAGAEFTDTRGNNVFAQEDADGNNKGGFRLDGGPNLLFDFPFDAAFNPSGNFNEEASTVNLFYWSNLSHDIFYHYGFDEASGNFQQNNYGHDGIAADPLQADTLDRTSINNANFGTPPDGQKPRMQMFVWTLTAPYRDSALENNVIVHEYGHGISNRLTGGPSNVNCLFNMEQMGEGWSDWLALAITAKASDSGTDARGTGAYLLGQPPNGRGIRFYPYSTDMTINSHTYDSIQDAVSVHQVGEVWAEILWEMYWVLVEEHGFNPNLYEDWRTGGNNLAIQLVMDGMKLQPCSPGFVDGRDAILAADALLTGGTNQCLIWDAFAKRGLGLSADQGDSESITDGSEAFDTPSACHFLSVIPPSQDICVGQTAAYQVRVGPAYTPPVNMGTTALPNGTSSTFGANSVLTTPTTITLGIATDSQNTVAGSYPITVTGTDSDHSSDITAELNVFDATPGTVTLAEPADQATNVSRNLTFAWTPATQAATYIIEVDDDSDFSSIDYSATVTETTHTTTSSLSPGETAYWRVRAANPCDTGLSSATASFTTSENFPILVVDDDDNSPNVRPYYVEALEGLGLNVDVWRTGGRDHEPDASFLAPYDMVVWFTGDSFGKFAGPGDEGERALAEYLDQGGCLFLSSQTYHFDKGLTPFMQSYLGVDSILEDRWHTTITGDGAIFSGLGPYTLTYPLPNYSDLVLPDETAEVAFSSDMGSAAVYKESDLYRTSFFSFPFEAISTKRERQEVMQRMIDSCAIEQDIALFVGQVTDADSGVAIKNATVRAHNSRIQRTVTTDPTGHYTMTLTVDDYEMTVSAPHYEQQVTLVSADKPLGESPIRQDFALQGSQLAYDLDFIETSLQIGQIVTNTLIITNSGPLPINYNLTIGGNYRYFLPVLTRSNDFNRSGTTEVVTTGDDFNRSGTTGDSLGTTDDSSGTRGDLWETTEVVTTDEFGYTVSDSKQPGGPRYQFFNISSSGQLVVLGDNDSAGPFPIGFDFDFYGTPQSEFYINSDGFITFESASSSSAPSNQCLLPKARTPNHLIALMWDDFQPADVKAQVYYQNFSACPYGSGACLMVQYDNYHYYPAGNYRRATFEAILFETGDILMQYDHLGHRNGATSTTGLENADGTMGLTYGTCDTPGHIRDKQALCFAHPAGNGCDSKLRDWASVTPDQGTIPPNSSTTLDITFDATSQFQSDDSTAHLWFYGNFVNDPDPIPLTMSLTCPTCGVLSGALSDVEDNHDLSGGIEVTGPNDFDVLINSESYHLVVEPGTYHLTSNANGYLSESATVTVTEGVTVTTDFALIPDVAKVEVSRPFIEEPLEMGDLITHTVTITNFGVRALTVDLQLDRFEGPPVLPTAHLGANAADSQLKGSVSSVLGEGTGSREDQAPPPELPVEREMSLSQEIPRENSTHAQGLSEVADSHLFSNLPTSGNNRSTQGVTKACPTAYHWTGSSDTLSILLYADDIIHRAPNTFPDQALRARELTYAAYYDDLEELEECLTTETWDLVILANDRAWLPSSILTALNEQLIGGAKLIYHGWTVGYDPSHALWTNMGLTWKGNNETPDPLYWWQTSHPMFTNPKSVPQLTELEELDYLIYGQRVEPLPGALAVAGYQNSPPFDPSTSSRHRKLRAPQSDEAALIVGNNGRSVFKGFLDGPNGADLDADGLADGLELWINLIAGMQNGFDSSTQWARVYPDRATIAPQSSATFEVLFDTRSLYQVGEYTANLNLLGNFVNEVAPLPLTMPLSCTTCGLLKGSITDAKTGDPLPANIHLTAPNGFELTVTSDHYTLTLLPGTYELTIQSSGYNSQSTTLNVTQSMTTITDFALLPNEGSRE